MQSSMAGCVDVTHWWTWCGDPGLHWMGCWKDVNDFRALVLVTAVTGWGSVLSNKHLYRRQKVSGLPQQFTNNTWHMHIMKHLLVSSGLLCCPGCSVSVCSVSARDFMCVGGFCPVLLVWDLLGASHERAGYIYLLLKPSRIAQCSTATTYVPSRPDFAASHLWSDDLCVCVWVGWGGGVSWKIFIGPSPPLMLSCYHWSKIFWWGEECL